MMTRCGRQENHTAHEWVDGALRKDCDGVAPVTDAVDEVLAKLQLQVRDRCGTGSEAAHIVAGLRRERKVKP